MKRKAIILAALMALVAVPASGQVIRVITPGGGGSTGACALCLESDGTGWPITANTTLTDTGVVATFGGDVVANALKSIADNALAISATAPAATTGASQAGKTVTITASNAVASTDTAGAAAGGSVTITAGNAARLTSGNANGGDINLVTGTGIGTGTAGQVVVPAGTSPAPGVVFSGDPNTGFYWVGADNIGIATNGVVRTNWSTFAQVWYVGLNANGNTLSGAYRLVEANTSGSGSPNILGAATEAWKVLTNEGATAANYHTLPTAAAGISHTFVVQDADGLRVTAASGDTIRVIDKVTAAAGYIESTTIGSVVELVAINATEWIATSIHGVWTDGTFTYDDTGLTSP